jgi:hypothetical protein
MTAFNLVASETYKLVVACAGLSTSFTNGWIEITPIRVS